MTWDGIWAAFCLIFGILFAAMLCFAIPFALVMLSLLEFWG